VLLKNEYLGFIAATRDVLRTRAMAALTTLFGGASLLSSVVFQCGVFSQAL